MIYAALGDKDQAMTWLEKGRRAIQSGRTAEAGLRFTPLDSRFEELVRRVGLPR